MTVHDLCDTHGIGASDGFTGTLNDSVTQKLQTTVERRASEDENPVGKLPLSSEIDRMHRRL